MNFNLKRTSIYKTLSSIYYWFKSRWFKLVGLISRSSKISNNKIIVDNFGGKGFGGNSKYIVEALLKLNKDLDIVWLVSDLNQQMPKGVRKVKYCSTKSIREYCTAKLWIDNIKNSIKPLKKTSQFYLQTWHGGIGIKAVERMAEKTLSKDYVNAAKNDARQTNLMLSDSKWTTDVFQNWFWYNGQVVKSGFPRNDLLVNKPDKIISKVRSYFSVGEKQKIILYAPTFRASEGMKPYQYDFRKILTAFERKFKSDYVLLIRLHPNVASLSGQLFLSSDKFNSKKIFNASNYPDMQELIASSDILISDFSSCVFDGMISGCKIFLLAKDYKKYISSQRSLLFNVQDLPFPFSMSESTFLTKIQSFDEKAYSKQVAKFENKVQLFEDGNASERVARILLNEIGK